MKKVYALLAFFPVLLALTGCGIAIPKAIEVRAAPGIDVGLKIDLTKTIKDELKGVLKETMPKMAFAGNKTGSMVLVACKEVENIKKSELFSAVNEVIKDISVTVGTTSMKISAALQSAGFTEGITERNVKDILDKENDPTVGTYVNEVLKTTVNQRDLPYDIPPIDINIDSMGDILKDFKFKESAGELYIADYATGSQFDQYIGYEFGVNLSSGTTLTQGTMKKMPDEYVNFWKSGKDEDFPQDKPKGDGQSINNLFVDNKLNASFGITMKKDATIKELLTCLKDVEIKAEMIAWIPLKFEAESDGAFFSIPVDEMLGKDDLFQREEGKKDTMVKEMSIAISFSEETFNDMFQFKTMVIGNANPDGPFDSKYPLKNKYVEINFDKEKMKEINNNPLNNPFTPSIKILFNKSDELFIPWELKTASVTLKADLAIRVEL